MNGGATDDQCPLTFIYSFYVRFTGSRAAHLRVSGHVSNVAIDASTESAREDQRILDPIWGSMGGKRDAIEIWRFEVSRIFEGENL